MPIKFTKKKKKKKEIMALFLSLVDKVIWVRHHKSSLEVNRNKGEKSRELRQGKLWNSVT